MSNDLAIVHATLEAAAKYMLSLQLPNPDNLVEISNYNRGCRMSALGIGAIDPNPIIGSAQTIIINKAKWMQRWDDWRRYIAEGGKGSWPRDAFESLLDLFEDDTVVRVE